MKRKTNKILFSLLGSAVSGNKLKDELKENFKLELLPELYETAKKHDVAHLFALALKSNFFIENKKIETEIIKAIYRYEQLNYEYNKLCDALEREKIPFIPLKGSVLRKYYPEPWMRTSCDIDILVKKKDLERTISFLTQIQNYTETERATHDIAFATPAGNHVEIHFDLVEEGRANSANDILKEVWRNVSLKEGYEYFYLMTDEYFYFYHIAHMAKHFETGGCGIRPFIDLWILNNIIKDNNEKRNDLLKQGGLLNFSENVCNLSEAWLSEAPMTEFLEKLEDYILSGGVYGNAKNKVALWQANKGGRIGYLSSRIFISFDKLKRYYPILEKHSYLAPVMQVRRWFMLLRPEVAKMAKRELIANKSLEKTVASDMKQFLDDIGIK